MPFKARQFYNRRRKAPKVQPKRDWSNYNKKMKMRGDITIWLSPDVIAQWTIADRHYDGTGAQLLFSDVDVISNSGGILGFL
jgi:hypothetical protein